MTRQRRRRASKYYLSADLAQERRQPRGDLGLHRLPSFRVPSSTRTRQRGWEDRYDHQRIKVNDLFKMDPGPRPLGERMLILMLILVIAFICSLPLLGFIVWLF